MTLEQIIQNSVAPVIITAVFLWFMDRTNKHNADNIAKAEAQRAENAKALEQERRTHETTVFNLFASTLKQMVGEITKSNEMVVDNLKEHEKASQERYERMGNTQEIKDAIDELKKQLAGKRN